LDNFFSSLNMRFRHNWHSQQTLKD